jgi:hypothetical protein
MRSNALEAYKKTLQLSQEQREVLIGLMLGDGHLESQNEGRTYRLKIVQSSAHRAYIDHLYQLFADWVRTPPQAKIVHSRGHTSENWWFNTLSHPSLRFYAQQFYGREVKVVPRLIHRWLTPRALAYWFMDDGSVKSSQSKGVLFNTQGFTQAGVRRLCRVLEKNFGLQVNPRKQKSGQQIYVSGTSYEVFRDWVEPYMLPEMMYKIPPARQPSLPKE